MATLMPHELWAKAQAEHPDDPKKATMRYLKLMAEAGHLVEREHDTDATMLACGLPKHPRDLLTPEERKKLNADLAEIARQRRRSEASARDIPLA